MLRPYLSFSRRRRLEPPRAAPRSTSAPPFSRTDRAPDWSADWPPPRGSGTARSEEHTSELQSQSNLVCRLLLEKKKKQPHYSHKLAAYYAPRNSRYTLYQLIPTMRPARLQASSSV